MRPPLGNLGPCAGWLGWVLAFALGASVGPVAGAMTPLDLPPLEFIGGPATATPAPRPVLEVDTGRSLFWQDIWGGGYRHDGILFHNSLRPVWYSSGESVALFRDDLGALEVQPQAMGGTLANGSGDFDAEFENGVRVLLGRSLGDWYRLEFSWLGNYEWSDTNATRTPDEFQSIGFGSTISNSEINLRRRVRILDWPKQYGEMEFSTSLGFRYSNLDEDLHYRAQTNIAINEASVRTDNKMFGVQLGALTQLLFEDRGWIDLEFKGAILSNEIDVASVYTPMPGTPQTFTANEHRTSFLIDLSLNLNYQFTPAWTFRLGYSAIWLDGVALATQNLSSDAALPLINIDHSGETVFHGPSIGLVYAPHATAFRRDCPH